MRNYKKGLKRQGYMFAKRKLTNKKRNCYNCGSLYHLIAECPYESKDDTKKFSKRDEKP